MEGEVRRAQLSIEYLIVLGVVLLLIVVPAAVFLTSFTQESVGERVSQDQLDRLGEGITTSAEHVYYLGLYSQRTTTLPIPRGIQEAHIIHVEQSNRDVYYLRLTRTRNEAQEIRYYQTRAPIYPAGNYTGIQGNPFGINACVSEICYNWELEDFTNPGSRTFQFVHVKQGVDISTQ